MMRNACGRLSGAIIGAATLFGAPALGESLTQRDCLPDQQTRGEIARRGLSEPFPFILAASRDADGDPISVRLCRRDDLFVYEITILGRDGHIVRVSVDAASGKPHPAAQDHRNGG